MKFLKEIGASEWIILLICAAIIYCLFLIILKPFNNNWNIAWMGVIFGTFDLICMLYIYINNIIYRDNELDKIEREKTWIQRVCEKGL